MSEDGKGGGVHSRLDLILRRNGFQIIIHFLQQMECYGPTLCIAYRFIQSLTTAAESRFIGSVVRALDFEPSGPGSNLTRIKGFLFSLICYALFFVAASMS